VAWSYGKLATEVYQLDKPIGHSFGDVEYYQAQLAGIGGPVLEPAVGTGRILIPLLESGLAVTGIDTSPDMLGACRQNCRDRRLDPVLHEADMRTFAEPEAYAAVIIPAGSIVLLDGRRDTVQALDSFRRCLRPGGRLVLDVPAPRLITGTAPMRHWTSGPFRWTLQVLQTDFDAVANQVTHWLRYDKWADGELIAGELQPFRLQHWSLEEFRDLLAGAGFADVAVTADYQDGPPRADSDDWTFRAVRP
jgi:SAM-dependent methyltransferase